MKKSVFLKIMLISLIVFLMPIMVFANEDDLEIVSCPEYTEEYKKWLELPDDEKPNYIEPQIYEDASTLNLKTKSSVNTEEIVGSGNLPSQFTRSYYGAVKDQGETNTCWAYSSSTAFETNYFLTTSVKKEFSPMFIEYATSNLYNSKGFNRVVDNGGNVNIALAYATNGIGIVPTSSLGNKTITSSNASSIIRQAKSSQKVSDYIELTGVDQIKNYIYKYGVVPAYTYMNGEYFSVNSYDALYHNSSLAYCCNDTSAIPNHAVTLVGWDDNYTNSNIPGKKGAFKVLNSYGSSFGNNGLYYIFYDDEFVKNNLLYGVTRTDDIDYDYIYQYDEYGCVSEITMSNDTYAANVFSRQDGQASEQLTEISIYVPSSQSVKCYINANSDNINISNATASFNTGILEPGYHTIKLNTPIKLNGDKFAVIVKYGKVIPVERGVDSTSSWCYTATSNNGESYISGNGSYYYDLQDFLKNNLGIQHSNACIKAFTKKTDSFSINYNENKSDLENYLFDYKYYADHNIDLYCAFGYNQTALRNHWNQFGKAEGRPSSPILDLKYYVESNNDLSSFKNNYVGAYNHFVNFGFAEYRSSSPEYYGRYYKMYNSDLSKLSSMELIRHYYNYGKNELRQANTNYNITPYLFDAKVYAKFNQDVVKVYGNNSDRLRDHWYRFGISEGRIANMIFDAKGYLNSNSDVANVFGKNNYKGAYEHFVNYGFAEGRQGNVIFSAKYYLSNNSDLKNAFGNNYLLAVNHFTMYGKNEFRATSSKFNVSQYRAKNSDLNNAFGYTPVLYFEHYLIFGQYENRICL